MRREIDAKFQVYWFSRFGNVVSQCYFDCICIDFFSYTFFNLDLLSKSILILLHAWKCTYTCWILPNKCIHENQSSNFRIKSKCLTARQTFHRVSIIIEIYKNRQNNRLINKAIGRYSWISTRLLLSTSWRSLRCHCRNPQWNQRNRVDKNSFLSSH